jgi:Helix-turn-helix domain
LTPADVWLTRQEVADREKLPVATLNQWASQGKGPKYARFGRHARYRLSDVIAWENAQFGGDDAA